MTSILLSSPTKHKKCDIIQTQQFPTETTIQHHTQVLSATFPYFVQQEFESIISLITVVISMVEGSSTVLTGSSVRMPAQVGGDTLNS